MTTDIQSLLGDKAESLLGFNSPKISKHIEKRQIKEIHDEIGTSVAYYRMQTMNQSLIALLANGGKVEQINPGADVKFTPNINDGYLGSAPDIGAYEAGEPLPNYGPRPDGVYDE